MSRCRLFRVAVLGLALGGCPESSSDDHTGCCTCLKDKDLFASGTDEESCLQQLAVNDDAMVDVKSKCLVMDNCGTDCSFWTRPDECGTAAGCCTCLEGKHWANAGADAGPCMDTSANACAVRVTAGEEIPLSSGSQATVDQCLIDACRSDCKGYPPSPTP